MEKLVQKNDGILVVRVKLLDYNENSFKNDAGEKVDMQTLNFGHAEAYQNGNINTVGAERFHPITKEDIGKDFNITYKFEVGDKKRFGIILKSIALVADNKVTPTK